MIFVEPTYGDAPHIGPSTDDHAPSGISDGQEFLMQVYNAVTTSPSFWRSALMVISYDEHGGFFDHVSLPLIPAYRQIHEHAKAGDAAAVAADLSENPSDINLPDDAGLTPLHLAALHCHTNVVMLLLAKGAKLNRKAKDDATPLHLAAQEGCAEAITMLLAKGAKSTCRIIRAALP